MLLLLPTLDRNQGALILKIIQGQYERVNSTKYTPELCSMVDRSVLPVTLGYLH